MARTTELLHSALLCIAALPVVGACKGGPPSAPEPAGQISTIAPDSAAIREAREAFEKRDYEQAQSAYARATAERPNDAGAWEGFGEASFALFEASRTNPKLGNPFYHLQDAARGFKKAVELGPMRIVSLLGAAKVARHQGDGPAAGSYAQKAKDAVAKDTPVGVRFDVLMGLGEARALEYQQSVQKSLSPIEQAELYQRACEAYKSARAIRIDRHEPILQLAFFEYNRGARGDALQILINAIRDTPEQFQLQQYLCDLSLSANLLKKLADTYDGEFARLAETSATTTWYSGFVKMREAEKFRRERDDAAAENAYNKAIEYFRKGASMNAQFAATSRQQEALAIAGQAKILLLQNLPERAAEKLTHAFERDITVLLMADGTGETPLAISSEIGLQYFNNQELEAGAKWFERWLQLKGDVVSWLNKAGLMRRDLGAQLLELGKPELAKESFEASYRHYEKACLQMPDEPRLVNDTALILLYHLHRDMDKAEAMFMKSIELGEAKMAALGDRPEIDATKPETQAAAEQWDYFAEALGDAYQNIALTLWQRQGESAEIRKNIELALEYDPRGTRRWIREELKDLPASGPAPKMTRPLR
ncbi:MAG: hypothetical protein ACKVS6_06830 [Planctomycetota bacterium]